MTKTKIVGIDASRAVRQNRTGTENYSFELIKEFLVQEKNNHLRLYAPHMPQENMGTSRLAEWKILPQARLWSQIQLSKELRRNKPDVLFVPSHVVPLLSNIKSIVTIHDVAYRLFPNSYSRFDRRYLNFSTGVSIAKSSVIISPSVSTKKDICRFYKVDPNKIVVIAHGYNKQVFNPKLNYEDSPITKPYFFYVGRIEEKKNVSLLINAFVLLAKENKNVELVLAGKSGFGYTNIESQLKRVAPSIRSRIILPGYLPLYDTARYLKHALAFVFPSLYEGFGIPVLEAMGIGTPVICSNSSSLPEITGDAATMLPPSNPLSWAAAMSRIVHQPHLANQMREKGLIQASKYSWAKSASQTLKIINDVLNG